MHSDLFIHIEPSKEITTKIQEMPVRNMFNNKALVLINVHYNNYYIK